MQAKQGFTQKQRPPIRAAQNAAAAVGCNAEYNALGLWQIHRQALLPQCPNLIFRHRLRAKQFCLQAFAPITAGVDGKHAFAGRNKVLFQRGEECRLGGG